MNVIAQRERYVYELMVGKNKSSTRDKILEKFGANRQSMVVPRLEEYNPPIGHLHTSTHTHTHTHTHT